MQNEVIGLYYVYFNVFPSNVNFKLLWIFLFSVAINIYLQFITWLYNKLDNNKKICVRNTHVTAVKH